MTGQVIVTAIVAQIDTPLFTCAIEESNSAGDGVDLVAESPLALADVVKFTVVVMRHGVFRLLLSSCLYLRCSGETISRTIFVGGVCKSAYGDCLRLRLYWRG